MVCPNCGFNNTEGSTKCLICQTAFQNPVAVNNINTNQSGDENYYEETPKKKTNIITIVLIVLAIIIIIAGVVIFFVYNSKPKFTNQVIFNNDKITTLYGIYPNIPVQNETPCGETCLNIYYMRTNYSDNVHKEYETLLRNNNFRIYSFSDNNNVQETKYIKESNSNNKILVITSTINSQSATIKYEQLISTIEDLIEKELQ
ncbi:MAG: hypothetical protein GX861_04240 [Tenericutes bacterium]|nr:hypothetical protein [Mycoplasmatota bacterium]